MTEISRDHFNTALQAETQAALDCFEPIAHHFERQNAGLVHHIKSKGSDLRLATTQPRWPIYRPGRPRFA